MAIQMDCYGMTDIGKKRSSNEDQFLIADLSKSLRVHQTSLGLDHQTRLFGGSQGHLLVVADGMGGCAAGERASTLAIDSLAFLQNDRPLEQREASVDREKSNRTEDQAETVSCILRPGTDA